MTAFRDVLAFFETPATMAAGDRALEVKALLITGNYFRALGVRPTLGRFPDAIGERSPEGYAVVVLSHGFWQRQFGGDAGVLNRVIRLNDASLTVVGVGPAGFTGTVSGLRVDAFVPLQMAQAFEEPSIRDLARHGITIRWDSPAFNRLTTLARLSPGVRRHEAEKMAAVVYDRMKVEEETERIGWEQRGASRTSEALLKKIANARLTLLPAGVAGSQQLGTARTLDAVLSLLMAMVGLVLLVAAGNVANLLVARGSARARETTIRLVLGATRWRLLRARLIEALVLALLSGGVGFLVSSWLTALLPAVLGLSEMPPGVSAAPDWRVAVFTPVVSAATGVLVWGVSAIQVTRRASLPSPGGSSLAQSGGGRLVLRRAVVVAQVTLSAALLCGAALLTRSLVGLMLIDPGFDVHGLAALTLARGGQAYEADRARAVIADLVTQAGALSGVVSASASSHLPLSGSTGRRWLIADDPGMDRTAPVAVDAVQVNAGYFDTLRLPIIAGREFTTSDRPGGQNVAVLSEDLARRLFGARPAVGRRVTFSRADATDTAVKWANRDAVFDIEVVGVARDARSHSLRTGPALTIYRPQSQVPVGDEVRHPASDAWGDAEPAGGREPGAPGRSVVRRAGLRVPRRYRGLRARPRAVAGGAVVGIRRAGRRAVGHGRSWPDRLPGDATEARDRRSSRARLFAKPCDATGDARGGVAVGRGRDRGRRACTSLPAGTCDRSCTTCLPWTRPPSPGRSSSWCS